MVTNKHSKFNRNRKENIKKKKNLCSRQCSLASELFDIHAILEKKKNLTALFCIINCKLESYFVTFYIYCFYFAKICHGATDLLTFMASIALRKPSHTTSTFLRLVGTGWFWMGLPSGRGYMLQLVSSSLPITNCFQRSHFPLTASPRPSQPVLLTFTDLSSVRKRLMWLVESSCVMKVSMLSRKTCRGRRLVSRKRLLICRILLHKRRLEREAATVAAERHRQEVDRLSWSTAQEEEEGEEEKGSLGTFV